ncbi:hypothetical protein MNBD_GAMMA21-901 [hydrothermal vent metagenome]|uniref:Uncharacterized protein n=1 Tax=hydrothermal vent metagenome TaxID=652676 RepID=A0A3B0ZTM4_9ZZZZ
MKTIRHYFVGFITLLALSNLSYANPHAEEIEKILAQKEEPMGVVFEIVTSKSNSLDWALPLVNGYIDKLKNKFPEIDVVIVTHGSEQFALTTDKAKKQTKVHSLTQQLNKQGVQLHVCGTYAGWRGLTDEDFPEYVNVAAAGPAQINDYVSVGYQLVIIRQPD